VSEAGSARRRAPIRPNGGSRQGGADDLRRVALAGNEGAGAGIEQV